MRLRIAIMLPSSIVPPRPIRPAVNDGSPETSPVNRAERQKKTLRLHFFCAVGPDFGGTFSQGCLAGWRRDRFGAEALARRGPNFLCRLLITAPNRRCRSNETVRTSLARLRKSHFGLLDRPSG